MPLRAHERPPMQFRAPHCPPSNLQSCRAPLRAFQCPSEPPGAQQCPLEPSRAPQEPLRVGGTTLSGGRGPLPHPHLGRSTATARWISSPPRGGFSRRYWAAAQRHRNDSSGWSCPRVPDCRAPAGAGQSRSTSGKGHPSRCRCPPGEREARPSVLPCPAPIGSFVASPASPLASTAGAHRPRCSRARPLSVRSSPGAPGTAAYGIQVQRRCGRARRGPGKINTPSRRRSPVAPVQVRAAGAGLAVPVFRPRGGLRAERFYRTAALCTGGLTGVL